MLSRLTDAAGSALPGGDSFSRSSHAMLAGASAAAGETAASNRLLGGLSTVDHGALLAQMETVSLRAGEVLARPGTAFEYAWFPEGAIIAVTLSGGVAGAVEHEVQAIGRDGMLGMPLVLGVTVADAWGTVRVGGHALRIPADALRGAIAGQPAVRALFDRYVHASLLHLARAVTCGREHLTVPRLATLLLWLCDQRGSDDIALTHEQVARLLGVSRRASVTEALRVLKGHGLVGARRGGLHVANPHRLEEMACPCYHAVRAQFERAHLA